MGWCSDEHPEHEGYLIGLVKPAGSWRYRELGKADGNVERVEYLQVECSCGWRSPRFCAPLGTKFVPVCVLSEPAFEDFAVELWKEHVAATVARRGIEPASSGTAFMAHNALAPLRKAHFERQVEDEIVRRRAARRAG